MGLLEHSIITTSTCIIISPEDSCGRQSWGSTCWHFLFDVWNGLKLSDGTGHKFSISAILRTQKRQYINRNMNHNKLCLLFIFPEKEFFSAEQNVTHQPYWSVLSQAVCYTEVGDNIRTCTITNNSVAWRHSSFTLSSVGRLNIRREIFVSVTCNIQYIIWNIWVQFKSKGWNNWK